MTSHGVRQHATKDKGVIEVQSGQTAVDIPGCMDGRVCRYLMLLLESGVYAWMCMCIALLKLYYVYVCHFIGKCNYKCHDTHLTRLVEVVLNNQSLLTLVRRWC